MVLVIDGREYSIPTDFTIKKWLEVQQWTSDGDKLISTAMGIPLPSVKLMPEKTKTLAVSLIIATLYPSWNKQTKQGMINLNNITLGQFVDLEVFVSRNYRKTIKEIINVLYNIEVNENDSFTTYWPGIEMYLKWRITLYHNYKNLFDIGPDNEEVSEDLPYNKVDLAYNWYEHIMTLADEKFLNIEPVLNRPLIEALNYLAWYKTKLAKEMESIQKSKMR